MAWVELAASGAGEASAWGSGLVARGLGPDGLGCLRFDIGYSFG